ncbi:malectin domain-containing carbohydrate-binding protein [Poritiphilus flavus]|uniref:T9SS type A sorting domain-containing protein n=1 Tax=Poritiphilus flavus TaxID=2697053 RepID=A0A6L9ECP0_9FLAO|nr:malectin domain-containing carbohydrate-binding protein [Poritiphilus flavus]NAS12383.1 T9SS type A sorting domain-containing protein [Poritiphilus flavus]
MDHSYSFTSRLRYILPFFVFLIFVSALQAQINFAQSELNFNGNGNVNAGVTSLMYGPDGRLYVAEYPGTIKIFTVTRNSSNDYAVTAVESLSSITDIVNHNDDGTENLSETQRETTGLAVAGTATNPVIYVSSSDFRIGAGGGGGKGDVGLDTNSGIITRISWNGTSWDVVDLVRGLPRSEQNHAINGLEFTTINGSDYLIASQGGHTNAGAPSTNFVHTCEYALSAAVLSVNLSMINSLSIQTDSNGRNYIYDLPTLDDPTRPNANGITDPDTAGYDGVDVDDPFGGNDGLNQAIIDPAGPVQVFSPGYRNTYDLVVTQAGAVYVTDNGANGGWGGFPENEGGGSVTNNYDSSEPGSTSSSGGEQVNNADHLQLVTTDIQSYSFGSTYGGHPNPIRANPAGAGLYTTPGAGTTGAVFRTQIYDPDGSTPGSTTDPNLGLPANWASIVPAANPVEGDWRGPGISNPDGPDDAPVTTWSNNTNGIDEYTASNFGGALQGNLIAGVNSGVLRRVELNPDGSLDTLTSSFVSGLGGNALGVSCNSDSEIFPGTIWVGTLNGKIIVLEPNDLVVCINPGESGYDPSADYDSDGYTNQDEVDNQTDPCSGASQPADYDKSAGAPLISDLNDTDDDNDGILDQNDPFQLGDPGNSGSDAFTLPVQNGLFSDQQGLGGIYGLGMTGLMNNGDPNPNWLNWLDDRGQGPNPDDVLGGAAGLMTSHMTSGTANGTANTQEKGYQYGVQVDQSTGIFTVSGKLINFNGPLQLYGNTAAVNGELGIFMGDGTQSNFIKFVLTTAGLIASQEINDIPQTPVNVSIDIANRPQSEIVLYMVVNPSDGSISLEYDLDGGARQIAGTLTATGSILNAIQQSNTALAVGFLGTSNTDGVELEGTWDFLNVVPENVNENLRINAGGVLITATDAQGDWQANNATGSFSGAGFSVNTGNIFNGGLLYANRHSSIPSYIDETSFNAIFAQERWDPASGEEMEFTIPLINGDYTVNLYLGNSYNGTSQVGQRVFDIEIEGSLVENDLDLVSAFGHQSGGMLSYNVSLIDGALNIRFVHGTIENPLINGIEIVSNVIPDVPIVVQPIADQTNTVGEQLDGSLGVQASGGDGNLAYSATGLPPGITIEPTSGELGGTVATGADANSPYNVIITVDDSDGNTSDTVSTSFMWTILPEPTPPVSELRINAGGGFLSATDSGSDWVANDGPGGYTGSGYSVNNGNIFNGGLLFSNRHSSVPSYVDEATFNTIFAQERYSDPGENMEFTVPMINGDYTVNLFLGNSFGGTSEIGQRVFDIEIEGVIAFPNLDLVAEFGHLSGGMVSYDVILADGELNIRFLQGLVQNPLINAIEIVPTQTDPDPDPDPEVLWVEDFNDLSNGVTQDSGPTAWDSNRDSGLFEVQNGAFTTSQNSASPGVWTSQLIPISTNVSISIDIDDGDNNKETADFIRALYSLDGGTPVQFGEARDDISAQTFSVSGLSGSSLQIIVEADVSWSDEYYYFDNVTVSGDPVETYQLTVQSGNGGGAYAAGTSVIIVADPAPSGQEFDAWTGNTAALASTSDATTTLTMRASDITVSATYRDLPPGDLPWTETFDGLANGTTSDSGNTAWTSSRDNGVFEVRDGVFYVNRNSSNPGIWTSEEIVINGTVTVSVDVDDRDNRKENADFLRAYYAVDGGSPVMFGEVRNDISAQTFTASGINGSTLQIIVEADVSARREIYVFDNVSVVADAGQSAPAGLITSKAALPELEDGITTDSESTDDILTRFQLYPNPAVSEVTIAAPEGSEAVTDIHLFTLGGQLIMRFDGQEVKTGTNRYVLDISTLPEGLYVIRILGRSGQIQSQRLVVGD